MFYEIDCAVDRLEDDPTLLRMNSKKKVQKVQTLFENGGDRSESFQKASQHILYFSRAPGALNMDDFRSMIHKSRKYFNELCKKSDVDKLHMLALYIELKKSSKTMNDKQFFQKIYDTKELCDLTELYVYFGRLFVKEDDYDNLKIVVEKAHLELGENFYKAKELCEFEGKIDINKQFIRNKISAPTNSISYIFKEYIDFSYNEVFFANFLLPRVEDVGIDKNSSKLMDVTVVENKANEQTSRHDMNQSTSDDAVSGTSKLAYTSHMEAISFRTDISNKVASALCETLPPPETSMGASLLEETLQLPTAITPARCNLKRDRLINNLQKAKEISVYEDDNLTRTQVYVDQTCDVDSDIVEHNSIESPMRKKVNMSSIVEEIEKPADEDVVMFEGDVTLVKENSHVSGNNSQNVDRSGLINSTEFNPSFVLPEKADECNTSPSQKGAARPSLMVASTPCRGTQPMQMDQCSFYLDLSAIKGNDEDDVNVDEDSFLSQNVTVSEKEPLCMEKSKVHEDSFLFLQKPPAKPVGNLFDCSESRENITCESVDLFKIIEGHKGVDDSRSRSSKLNGETSHGFDKTVINNCPGGDSLRKTLVASDEPMDCGSNLLSSSKLESVKTGSFVEEKNPLSKTVLEENLMECDDKENFVPEKDKILLEKMDCDDDMVKSSNGVADYKLPENTSFNPWDEDFRNALQKLDDNTDKITYVSKDLGTIKAGSIIDLDGKSMKVLNLIAKGGFASVYKVNMDGVNKAAKIQFPAYPYETYICEQVRKRIPTEFISNFMVVDKTIVFNNCSVIINEYLNHGTLLDLANSYKSANIKPTCHIVGYLAIQIAELLKILKECQVIHADIKPDNFLIVKKPSFSGNDGLLNPECIIRLIDFGRAIDMKPLNNAVCVGKAATDCFDCVEMLENKPWTYQTDFYGFCVSVYLLLTTQYCYRTNINGKNSLIGNISSRQHPMKSTWEGIVEKLLNIPSIDDMPSWDWVLEKIKDAYSSLLEEYEDDMEDYFNKFTKMIDNSTK